MKANWKLRASDPPTRSSRIRADVITLFILDRVLLNQVWWRGHKIGVQRNIVDSAHVLFIASQQINPIKEFRWDIPIRNNLRGRIMQSPHRNCVTCSAAMRWLAILLLTLVLFPQFTAAQNWLPVAEIPAGSVYALAAGDDRFFAATDSVIYLSADGGATWIPAPAQPPSTRIYALHYSKGHLYAGTSGDGVFRSANGGQSWQALNAGLSGFSLNIAGFTTRGDTLYAATNGSGVYLLNLSNPESWKSFNSGLSQLGASSILTSDQTLVACLGSYVFTHAPGTLQWRDTTGDLLQGRLPLVVYRHADQLFLGTTGGIYRSDLAAADWQRVDIQAMPEQDIYTFAAHGSRLFAGLNYRSQHWIWSTDNYGATWEIRSHEFAYLYTLFPAHGRMWAGRTDGLWSIDLSGWMGIADEKAEKPDTPSLSRNYPNPFNPVTTLSFHLPAAAAVSLKVFDAEGREVAMLVNEERAAGAYSCQWNAAGMASGVYLARLQADSFVESRKLVLIR